MADAKPSPDKTYDERIYRKGHPPHRIRNALILIVLLLIGTYLGATKEIPFQSHYEIKAMFTNAANIRKDSPVRIAGVNVGKVVSVRSVGENAEVTFRIEEEGRPVRSDAQAQIRPRIFLEGNFFVDLKPGSPSAEELDDGGTIPVTRTSTAVQLDQVLTTLQAPDRENLQKLLRGYGDTLNHQPTAAEDKGQDPDAQGETAAQAINDSFQYGAAASRDSAIVNEALLGTEPHDLSGLVAAQSQLFGVLLQREEQLKDLITNFNTTAGAFASESDNLEESIRLLGPTLETAKVSLEHTNEVFPFLRAFARDIRPGIRELPATIAASPPWMKQASKLLNFKELGYIADELRRAAPGTGAAAHSGISFFRQIELLSRCGDQVLFPTGDVILDDSGVGFEPPNTPFDFSTDVPNYKEFAYAAAGLAGESQNFDGNGPYLRFLSGNGPQLVRADNPAPAPNTAVWGRNIEAPLGTRPVVGPNKPELRPDVACHTNALPDLNGPAADVGPNFPDAFP